MDASITESATLLNAQLSFLDTHVALVHIPLKAYHLFLQPILHLILHNDNSDEDGQPIEPHRPWQYWHPFVNISITPSECSIVCPRQQAERLFRPILHAVEPSLRKAVSISPEDYSVIVISGSGLEAGQRVLDLTGPLALAGIPIFFITSYYTDFILVPFAARGRVIHALEDRGFVFEATANGGEAGHMTNPASPLLQQNCHRNGSTSSFDFPSAPSTPPPTSVSELQTRTFKLLNRHHIRPSVDPSIELVTCAGIKDTPFPSSSTPSNPFSPIQTQTPSSSKLALGLTRLLTLPTPPTFLSLTLTDTDSLSLTLSKHHLAHFPAGGEDLLLGKDGPEQVPITFDLAALPAASTGIVCGVAGRLVDGLKGKIGAGLEGGVECNMSYLSTARAGHVIVWAEEVADAVEALRGFVGAGEGLDGMNGVNAVDGHKAS